uniref:Uncharacterized protein n=1 Tax=Hyaloperonospora arabidopsidis (strain Emoy2) TaxID=559515 RepID=M4BI48_HYAAE
MLGLTKEGLASSRKDPQKLGDLLVKLWHFELEASSLMTELSFIFCDQGQQTRSGGNSALFRDKPSMEVFSRSWQRRLAEMHPDTIKTITGLHKRL